MKKFIERLRVPKNIKAEYEEKLIHYQVEPDSRLTNSNVERLAQSLCEYKPFAKRVNSVGYCYQLKRQNFLSFEVVLKKQDTRFYITALERNADIIKKALESTWNKSTIKTAADPFEKEPDLLSKVEYNYHYIFSIRIDYRKQNGIMENLLETLNVMKEDDEIYVQIIGFPANKDWHIDANEKYKKFREGKVPRKIKFGKALFVRGLTQAAARLILGTIDTVVELTGGEPEKVELEDKSDILKDSALRRETIQKTKGEAYEFEIRIGVICKDGERAEALKRITALSFRELDGDNQLIETKVFDEKFWYRMKNRSKMFKIQKDFMSVSEFSRLMMLPMGSLQEQYKIKNINTLEIDIPERLLKGGIYLGDATFKGTTQKVYFPTSNLDELCLPSGVIAGMGQGKTKGYGANKAVQWVKNGFGSISIDPAKGELGKEIESGLGAENVLRIDLGKTPIAIDWRETEHAVRSRNRLANTVIGFFGNTDDTGGQTIRFLRAAIFGMESSNLKELLKMFEDETYLKARVQEMPDSIHKQTLKTLAEYGEGRRRQILDPIYNRLDDIMGDEYLAECFDAENGIDFVELMSKGQAIVIDIPQALVGDTGVNLIGNLLMTKINLAMTLRPKQIPYTVIIDEPHQFTRSKSVWKTALVESRKWRIQYTFMFHDFLQLDRELRDIMRSAGSNFHIYPTSKKHFIELSEEISPFTIQDGLNLQSHHAINVIRSGGDRVTPFILKMAKPPSKQG